MSTYAGRLVDPYGGPRELDALIWVMQIERNFYASTPDPEAEHGYGVRQLELLHERLVLPDHGLLEADRERALAALERLLPLPTEERRRLAVVLGILPQRYLREAFGAAKREYCEDLAKEEGIEEALTGDVRRKLSKRRSRMKAERRLGVEPELNPALISDGSRAWTVGPLAGAG